MKILLVSFFRLNDITPRAFRVKSLHDGLIILGHEVEIVCALESSSAEIKSSRKRSTFTRWLREHSSIILNYCIPDGPRFFKACQVYNKLKDKRVDLTISIGLPFTIHLCTALAIRAGHLRTKAVIADYGDPFTGNPIIPHAFYMAHVERWVLRHFTCITVPVASAVTAYSKVAPEEKVVVIPQGFDLSLRPGANYIPNKIPTFAYAGNLYRDIRDPTAFLNELTRIRTPFAFHIYTELSNRHTLSILEPFIISLNGRLFIHDKISRLACLEELSHMDFLINFANNTAIQSPSKLIDYTLSSRPFIEIKPAQIEYYCFYQYLSGDYSGFRSLDISAHDMVHVAKLFISTVSKECTNS